VKRRETLKKSDAAKYESYRELKDQSFEEEKFEESFDNHTSVLTPFEEDFVKAPNTFFEDNIVSSYDLQFLELEAQKGSKEEIEMNTYGLWRLEPQNIFKGGPMVWDQPYRLKNIASGKYLKVTKKAANV